MTRDAWLAAHPYLQPVADVDTLVEAAAAELSVPTAPLPDWDAYADDFHAGVPLLQSSKAAIDLSRPEDAALALIKKLASSPLPGTLAQQCRVLEAELHLAGDPPGLAEARVPSRDSFSPTHPGLFRYLGWAVLVRYLSPVVSEFNGWRNEERWLRNYCPTCGEPPAMAQLVGKDPGRLRKLSCGRCKTRWRYRRTGCPFCDVQDEHRLAVVAVEGEGGLRIDYCETCGGYLKTYDGEGSECVLLADWTSLHLDVIARDRGLKRLAASLYDL
jgi:FdhE protein